MTERSSETDAAPEPTRRILVTGIASTLAGMAARALERDDRVLEIIGVDTREPQHDLTRTEFVRADITNPVISRVVEASGVDTIVHLDTVSSPGRAGGRANMKEHNVIGAMQLFAAAQHAPTVRKVVLKSTTAVYGSNYDDPALFSEDDTPSLPSSSGWAKDATEVEGYARGLGRRRADIDLTILRFANFLGATMDSTIGSFFALPVVPIVLGFDARLQFIHEDDAVEAVRRSSLGDHPGIYNVSGDGIVYLSQCIRIAGRIPVQVPSPLASTIGGLVRRTKRVDFSAEQLRFLQFGRAADTSALRREFDWSPRYSSRDAFEDFVSRRKIQGMVNRDEVVRWERELYDFIQRKGQERFIAARRGM